jgi:rsbT co-antagonist protein RsbR
MKEATALSEQAVQDALNTIGDVLQSVEGGDLSARIALAIPENDPLGVLATCINRMTDLLAQRREETISIQRQLEGQIETIEKQRVAIRELSTPIIEVWSGVLCAPIVGVLDSVRASDMTSALLHSVVRTKASLAIIDITGIEAMDTQATDYFLRMARAIRLLGSECALSGVHPNVARTIVHMGIELGGIDSYRTLRDALHHHVNRKAAAPRRTQG